MLILLNLEVCSNLVVLGGKISPVVCSGGGYFEWVSCCGGVWVGWLVWLSWWRTCSCSLVWRNLVVEIVSFGWYGHLFTYVPDVTYVHTLHYQNTAPVSANGRRVLRWTICENTSNYKKRHMVFMSHSVDPMETVDSYYTYIFLQSQVWYVRRAGEIKTSLCARLHMNHSNSSLCGFV